ncbi:MAG: hypothetical protein KatS3mg110_1971 [Pirellulaceae bacterium]|nr:MAG: hypothetical protein KatS3mg110_1971 [Pirellulaceae bacterium]
MLAMRWNFSESLLLTQSLWSATSCPTRCRYTTDGLIAGMSREALRMMAARSAEAGLTNRPMPGRETPRWSTIPSGRSGLRVE